MKRIKNAAELQTLRQRLLEAQDPQRPVVRVCLGPGCLALGAEKVAGAFRSAIKTKRLKAKVQPLIKETGCHGFCSQGTLVSLSPADLFYVRVKPEDVPDIVEATMGRGEVLERLLYSDNGARYRRAAEIPFLKCSRRLASKMLGSSIPWTLTTPSWLGPTGPWPRP